MPLIQNSFKHKIEDNLENLRKEKKRIATNATKDTEESKALRAAKSSTLVYIKKVEIIINSEVILKINLS